MRAAFCGCKVQDSHVSFTRNTARAVIVSDMDASAIVENWSDFESEESDVSSEECDETEESAESESEEESSGEEEDTSSSWREVPCL